MAETTTQDAPIKASEVLDGQYLTGAELPDAPVTLRIERANRTEVEDRRTKKPKKKIELWFVGLSKSLLLNKTNGAAVLAMFGQTSTTWIGKRITIRRVWGEGFGVEQWLLRIVGSPDIAEPVTIKITEAGKTKNVKLTKTPDGPAKET